MEKKVCILFWSIACCITVRSHPLPSSPMARCSYCSRSFPTTKGLHSHQAQDLVCQWKRAEDQTRIFYQLSGNAHPNLTHPSPPHPTTLPSHDLMEIDTDPEIAAPAQDLPQDQPEPTRRKRGIYRVPPPTHLRAGESKGRAETRFERIRRRQQQRGHGVYGRFQTAEDWDLAKWLIKNVGQNATDSFLKLPIVSTFNRGH